MTSHLSDFHYSSPLEIMSDSFRIQLRKRQDDGSVALTRNAFLVGLGVLSSMDRIPPDIDYCEQSDMPSDKVF